MYLELICEWAFQQQDQYNKVLPREYTIICLILISVHLFSIRIGAFKTEFN